MKDEKMRSKAAPVIAAASVGEAPNRGPLHAALNKRVRDLSLADVDLLLAAAVDNFDALKPALRSLVRLRSLLDAFARECDV